MTHSFKQLNIYALCKPKSFIFEFRWVSEKSEPTPRNLWHSDSVLETDKLRMAFETANGELRFQIFVDYTVIYYLFSSLSSKNATEPIIYISARIYIQYIPS